MTLSRAYEAGYYVRARCGLCNTKRVYDPSDLQQLAGDVDILELERRIRCDKCRKKEFMRVEFWYPTGQEKEGLRLRRLAGIKMVRRVIWRDD